MDAVQHKSTNGTNPELFSPDVERKILNISRGGTVLYCARHVIKEVIIKATPNLLI